MSRDAEATARARIPHAEEYYDLLAYDIDALGGYRLRPNQRLPHVSINEHGYRGNAFTGNELVAILGDSVTFGVGASGDDARLSGFLASRLGCEVADASVRAYRAFQHYGHLPKVLALMPRLRLLHIWCGYADLLYWVVSGGCVDGAFQFEWKYQTPPAGWPGRVARVLFPRAFAARDQGRGRARDTGGLDELAAMMALHIGAIDDLCASRGIVVDVLLQPFVRSRPPSALLREITDPYDDKARTKCGISWYEAAPLFIDALRSKVGELVGSRCLDCQLLVTEDDFLDQVHLSEGGLRKIAGVLAERAAARSEVVAMLAPPVARHGAGPRGADEASEARRR